MQEAHGGFGCGVRNEEGRMLLEFTTAHDMDFAYSFFVEYAAQLEFIGLLGFS